MSTHPHPMDDTTGLAEPDGPRLLLTPRLPEHPLRRHLTVLAATDPRVRMQPFGSVIGSTQAIHTLMFPCRYDHHLKAWHSYRRLKDADQRSAAVVKFTDELCARVR